MNRQDDTPTGGADERWRVQLNKAISRKLQDLSKNFKTELKQMLPDPHEAKVSEREMGARMKMMEQKMDEVDLKLNRLLDGNPSIALPERVANAIKLQSRARARSERKMFVSKICASRIIQREWRRYVKGKVSPGAVTAVSIQEELQQLSRIVEQTVGTTHMPARGGTPGVPTLTVRAQLDALSDKLDKLTSRIDGSTPAPTAMPTARSVAPMASPSPTWRLWGGQSPDVTA